MSKPNDKDIEIKDLPSEENLTPEEKERLAGAGRPGYRLTLENLEAREMMTATGGIASAVGAAEMANVRRATQPPPAPMAINMDAGTSNASAKVLFEDNFN